VRGLVTWKRLGNQALDDKMSKSILVLVLHVESPRKGCNRNYEFRRRMLKSTREYRKYRRILTYNTLLYLIHYFCSVHYLKDTFHIFLFLVFFVLKIGFVIIKEANYRESGRYLRADLLIGLKVYFRLICLSCSGMEFHCYAREKHLAIQSYSY